MKKKYEIEKRLTCERRAEFSTANISKVQQQALLQRIENVLARYLLGTASKWWDEGHAVSSQMQREQG
jgi:hypothetical protein